MFGKWFVMFGEWCKDGDMATTTYRQENAMNTIYITEGPEGSARVAYHDGRYHVRGRDIGGALVVDVVELIRVEALRHADRIVGNGPTDDRDVQHTPTLTTRLHAPRNARPIGRIMFRDECSCGWRGEWLTTAGLAHSAHDWHKRAETTDPELSEGKGR